MRSSFVSGGDETSAFEPEVNLVLPAGWASLREVEEFFYVHRPLAAPEQGVPVRDVAVIVAALSGTTLRAT